MEFFSNWKRKYIKLWEFQRRGGYKIPNDKLSIIWSEKLIKWCRIGNRKYG